MAGNIPYQAYSIFTMAIELIIQSEDVNLL